MMRLGRPRDWQLGCCRTERLSNRVFGQRHPLDQPQLAPHRQCDCRRRCFWMTQATLTMSLRRHSTAASMASRNAEPRALAMEWMAQAMPERRQRLLVATMLQQQPVWRRNPCRISTHTFRPILHSFQRQRPRLTRRRSQQQINRQMRPQVPRLQHATIPQNAY
ncbi:hypothetical protein BC831DRAFT_457878 [Entophlyctis helioformis]|nr:hypothetical protein BC831DRAFT_457878 [Entophlyctis helioformis]